MRRGRRSAGFTFIEMMAVVLLTATVLIASVNLYLQLAGSTAAAADTTRTQRRAVLLLDRMARDLEGAALLVRPDDVDPLAWPWLFLAEAGAGGEAADRLKFDTRSFVSSKAESGAGDLAVVAWWLEPAEEEGFELLRWSAPHLPESLERQLPRRDDPAVRVVADDVARFGVRLLDEEGSWHEEWDSSTLTWSNQLPAAAEIVLALLPPDPTVPPDEAPLFTRQVRIPVRPLDLQALQEAAAEEAEGEEEEEESEEDGDCVTVAQCRQRNPQAFEAFLSSRADRAAAEAVLDSLGGQCFSDHAGTLGLSVEGCE